MNGEKLEYYLNYTRQNSQNISNLAARIDSIERELNQSFLIIMGVLMMLMQAGFAFIEASCCRAKNAGNALLKNVLDTSVSVIAYWTIGFALAYGRGNSFIGYEAYWASSEIEYDYMAFFFFEFVFAATAATLVSGAVSERCDFIAYFIYSFLTTGIIYPVVTHWAWTDIGWLKAGLMYDIHGKQERVGFHDFSGSGAVHLVGGTAALVGATILGPRIGRWHPETGADMQLKGHSVPFAALGAFLLLPGFLAFNGGSQLTVTRPGDNIVIALAITNTIISGSMSAFSALVVRRLMKRNWSVLTTVNGCICGMVAVCGGCDVYRPWGACIVGVVAGAGYNLTSWWVAKVKIDDPVDAVGVHFNGGLWGVIAVAFFRYPDGILCAWDRRSGLMLAWQIVGLFAIILWSGTLSAIMFGTMKGLGILRVSEEIERKGLDLPIHGEHAYPPESYDDPIDVEKILKIMNGNIFSNNLSGRYRKESRDHQVYDMAEFKIANFLASRKISQGMSITPSEIELVVKNKEGLTTRTRRSSYAPSEMEIVVKNKDGLTTRTRRSSYAPSEMEIVVRPTQEYQSRVNEAFEEESEIDSINYYRGKRL